MTTTCVAFSLLLLLVLLRHTAADNDDSDHECVSYSDNVGSALPVLRNCYDDVVVVFADDAVHVGFVFDNTRTVPFSVVPLRPTMLLLVVLLLLCLFIVIAIVIIVVITISPPLISLSSSLLVDVVAIAE